MYYEWDDIKNLSNISKHGISFEEAQLIFDGSVFIRADRRRDYGENRYIALGALSPDVVLVVVYTWRGLCMRLVSARKASVRERKIYHEYLKKTLARN